MSVHEATSRENNPEYGEDSDIDVDTALTVSISKPTPLPKLQISIIFLTLFSEPITAMVIYPFINQFVRETGVTQGDENKTGYYAGIVVRQSNLFWYTFIPINPVHRNRRFSWPKALQSCSGAICQIVSGVDQSYFLVHLVWRFRSLFSVHRLPIPLLWFRDFVKACSMHVLVSHSFLYTGPGFLLVLTGVSQSMLAEVR